MEYYGLRKAGNDIDLVIAKNDHENLSKMYPKDIKDLYGDLGICVSGFEIWNTICSFNYDYLSDCAIEKEDLKIVSLEKLLFLKALAIKIPKYQKDLKLIVQKILDDRYTK